MNQLAVYPLTAVAGIAVGVGIYATTRSKKPGEPASQRANRPMTNAELIRRQEQIRLTSRNDPKDDERRRAWQAAEEAAIELAPGVIEIISPTTGQKIIRTTSETDCEALVWDGRCGMPRGRIDEFNACRDRVLRNCAKGKT
jgi:hypothetical protein